ncbi:MAG: hypothetical protein A2W23_00120 [Planctomycetes bacterium RBG_16_43_13]|nr:MAG: hypothetical protein A2W23_00120 [Planctomycetes bacterium RBG_16_43_13]
MKPITAKGGEYMPRPKRQIMHELSPKFSTTETNYKALVIVNLMGMMSMSGWVKMQVERDLDND